MYKYINEIFFYLAVSIVYAVIVDIFLLPVRDYYYYYYYYYMTQFYDAKPLYMNRQFKNFVSTGI